MGNRFRGGINPAMPPLHKYFGNPGLTKSVSISQTISF
jgi:hypothetical protein